MRLPVVRECGCDSLPLDPLIERFSVINFFAFPAATSFPGFLSPAPQSERRDLLSLWGAGERDPGNEVVSAAELNRKAPGTRVDVPCANRDLLLMSSDYSEVVTVIVFYTGHKGPKHLKMVRPLTRDIFRLFIAMLAIVVFLQLGFYFYTNFFPGRFTSPLSSSRPFYKDLDKRELGNAQIQTKATRKVTLYAHFNTQSNWKPFEHKTTLITKRPCAQYYSLLILVSSAPGNLQRRNYIRKTWAFENASKPRWTTVFLVAQTRSHSESNSLLKEDEVYGDLVRADYYDHYWNQTLKIQMGFEWATRYCKFSFLLKADDDVFVNSAELLSFLSDPMTTPKKKLYMGIHRKHPLVQRRGKWKITKGEYSGRNYPDFCPGFGFVLSYDVAITFVKAFSFVPYYRMDDVYVGMLANRTGIKITHNAGFEMSAPKQCNPNEGTLVRHGFYKRKGTEEDCLIEIFYRSIKVLNNTGSLT